MSDHRRQLSPQVRAVFWLLVLVLVLAPLHLSGKPPLAVMVLELVCMVGFAVLAWGGKGLHHLHRIERWSLAALLVLPGLYLLPLPLDGRLMLPGQADYYAASKAIGSSGWTTITLDIASTLKALLYLLMPITVFWMTRALPASLVRKIVGVFLAMAVVQACIGLIQYGVADDLRSFWHFGEPPGHNARGTWSSRNNFAGFLNFALMIALALFMATLGRHKQIAGSQTVRERLVYLSTWQGHRAFVFGFIAVLVLVALVFTRSRMGIVTSMVGILIATIAFARRIGGDNVYGLTGTVVAGVLGVGVTIGLGPVLARFSQQDPLADGRSYIFDGAWEGIGHFFPLGSGPGTFVEVFPRFQAWEMASVTINRAHNSYLEWLFTMGLPAALLIALFLFLYFRQWFRMGEVWTEFRFIQTGAGLACLLTMIHDVVDYNFFVPANIIYFAFMAGLFFHPHRDIQSDKPTSKRASRKKSAVDQVRSRDLLPAVESQINPFNEDIAENSAENSQEKSDSSHRGGW
jgi:O-antigen ligase